ncbi:MAG: hypothetical protein F6K40_06080 [Okeania sp. SIO3I5]|uniref:hypothetical protein n=1 Tax=Okeania sp. SIO3I5 TaxID=2607805 RepID=UPI0013BB75BB|nr:hypothetical protein [Okeania sp. SIO3I5]NEQ35876.1 hypothetical protein [Okeania sp. SIO3I5]
MTKSYFDSVFQAHFPDPWEAAKPEVSERLWEGGVGWCEQPGLIEATPTPLVEAIAEGIKNINPTLELKYSFNKENSTLMEVFHGTSCIGSFEDSQGELLSFDTDKMFFRGLTRERLIAICLTELLKPQDEQALAEPQTDGTETLADRIKPHLLDAGKLEDIAPRLVRINVTDESDWSNVAALSKTIDGKDKFRLHHPKDSDTSYEEFSYTAHGLDDACAGNIEAIWYL